MELEKKKKSWIAINRHSADAALRVVKQINLSNNTQLRWSRLSVCVSTGCDFVGQAELTVENKSKQPSLLMTQYTSGRRGPFPVGCKRKEQTGWTKLCNEVRNLARGAFRGCCCQCEFTPLSTQWITG